ncbi:Signal recognition particle protein [Alphaproteobacteria bacterium SO-S41]|nr:Signal recognition particle protein [Alphaproteobacteria bacterium SO-S41]
MFDTLTTKLGQVFDRLRGRGALSEADVNEAMREVRVALLEADVALNVVKDFIEKVRVKAIGQDVLRSVTPGQQVIKIVNDELTAMLGDAAVGIDLEAPAPVVIMMVGLQGSGKTTSTAKIALRLTKRDKKKVLMASLDVQRPAAQEQLRILGEQAGVATLPVISGQMPADIAKRAVTSGRLSGYDVVLLDTAGRLHIDEQLMAEIAAVRDIAKPHETLLVADALTGQDAVNIAKTFKDRVGITGLVLTRMDGDGRGGAALSMRAVTGAPIKLIGVGEKLDALEDFHPGRVAGRILGMGDIVSLVEKAGETLDAEKAAAMAKRMEAGNFTLDDLSEQLKQMQKIGGMKGVLGMLPGVGKMKQAMESANLDEKMFLRQQAMISSMTKIERAKPDIINGSRRKRIAKGSGVEVSELNKLLKMHRQMADMMKELRKGKRGGLAGMAQMFGLGGGAMPQLPPNLPPGFGRK